MDFGSPFSSGKCLSSEGSRYFVKLSQESSLPGKSRKTHFPDANMTIQKPSFKLFVVKLFSDVSSVNMTFAFTLPSFCTEFIGILNIFYYKVILDSALD